MKLIFYGRQAALAVDPATALLTIEQKGVFSLNTGAVRQLGLTPSSCLVLASDAETNAWYLLLQLPAGEQSFSLRPRDSKSSKALVFHSQPQARSYWQAHGLNGQKSVRAFVSATPIEHDGLKLYPLTPQHPTKMPAPAPAPDRMAVLEQRLADIRAKEEAKNNDAAQKSSGQPDVAPLPSELPFLQAQQPAVSSEVEIEEPAKEAATIPAPASKYTPEQDAALLDMSNSPSELARMWGVSAAALHTRRAYLKKKAGEVPAPVVTTPTTSTLVYTPATTEGLEPVKKTFGLQARAEELTNYWFEREIDRTTPGELAEILNLLRHVPSSKRGFERNLVLERAEAEQAHRLTAAGKGGNRG